MVNFIFSLNVTMPIFVIILLGGLLKKIGMLTEDFASIADIFVFRIALPVQLFKDIAVMDLRSDFHMSFVIFCIVATCFMFGFSFLIGKVFLKDKSMVGAFGQASARGSCAILGIAFAENIYGSAGMTPMMIVAAVPFFNIFAVILLSLSGTGKLDAAAIKKTLRGIITNPIIIGIFAGMVWNLLRLPYPVILQRSVNYVSSTATPLALLVLGATFKGKDALTKLKPTIGAAMMKLVILPALILPVAIWLGFGGAELVAILIMTASPTAIACYIMAKNMGGDDTLTASVVMTATLLSSITLTLWVFLLRTLNLI